MLRTHTCGELTKKESGKKVRLCGWVDSLRLQGKIGFITIRDRYGKTQLFLGKELAEQCKSYSRESVILVEGEVKLRPNDQINKDMKTGKIEISASRIELLSRAEPLPMELDEAIHSTEETRLKYRVLDLRKEKMQKNLMIRSQIYQLIRDYFHKNGFVEIETPALAKSTPEGARDYLVPSRMFPGKFFALPQSPQLFKQLLMVSGFDRYFQIVKCYRDEDLRADRQPEFTQLDIEMSFIEEGDIIELIEGLIIEIWGKILNIKLKKGFQRISYADAMKKYKRDAPDIRKKGEKFGFCWVVDFPLFTYCETEKRMVSTHHPFTMPKGKVSKDASSRAYDIVLNGCEVGGGSIRIHNVSTQMEVFKFLGISEPEAKEKFGFLLKALSYGAPPHGGIALGLDRLVAMVCGEESIREVIAFPKNKDSRDLMLDAPSPVSKEQLDELGLRLK